MSASPPADRPVSVAVDVVPEPVSAPPPLGIAVTCSVATAELPSLQSMAGLYVAARMVDGSVTVTLKTSPLDSFVIGICCGRPSVVPNKVADVACRLPHVTWKLTAVPGVTVDGLATATALPGGPVVPADAGSDPR